MGRRKQAPAKSAGVRPRGIADALFSQTQQRVLSLIFGQPDRSFAVSELIKLVGSGSGAVQRELQRLIDTKLVVSTSNGKQKRYQASTTAPIFEELRSIVEKTAGIPDQLRRALAPLANRIQIAVLFGSVAKGTDTANSDIDVLLVSDDLALDEVFTALEAAEQRMGRHVSPTLYTSDEFHRRRRTGQPFVTRILDGRHIVLLGNEDAIAAPR